MLSTLPLDAEFEQLLPPDEGGFLPEQATINPEMLPPGSEEYIRDLGDAGLLMASENEVLARRDLSTLWMLTEHLFTGEFTKASAGEQYGHLFGRDSQHVIRSEENVLRVVESDGKDHNLIELRLREVIERGICSMVRYIGTRSPKIGDKWRPSGEEPGKMFHEVGKIAGSLEEFAPGWQDSDETDKGFLVYYGSADSTPQFVVIVSDYDKNLRDQKSAKVADELLMYKVELYRGGVITIGEAITMNMSWLVNSLHESDLGLPEYQRHPGQEKGIPNQVLKDSLTSYVHQNGELANTNEPIASVEELANAYDALMGAADMFERTPDTARRLGVTKQQMDEWRQEAFKLREEGLERFWIAGEGRFAQAIDRDPRTGKPRLVKTPTSNELELLDSRLIHDLPEDQQQKFVTSLVRQAMSDEFLTDAGIRCRAKSAAGLIDFYDYHGSLAVWPVITGKVSNGLLGWGFNSLAEQIDARLNNTTNIAGEQNEFTLVDNADKPFYRYITKREADKQGITDGAVIIGTNIPQKLAMSEGPRLEAKVKRTADVYNKVDQNRLAWVAALEEEILAKIKHVAVIKDLAEIERLRSRSPLAIIDTEAGKAADARYYELADRKQHTQVAA